MTRRFSGYKEEKDVEAFDVALLRRLWIFVRPYRWAFAICLLTLFVSLGLEIARPYLLRLTLDGPVRDALATSDASSRAEEIREVYWLGLWYGLSTLISVGLGYFYTMTTTLNGQRIIRDVRGHLFRHLLSLSPRYFDRNPAGKLVTRVTSDIENLNELIATGVLLTLFDLLKIGGLLFFMAWIHTGLFLFTLAVTPLILVVSLLFRKHARTSFRSVRGRLAKQNAFAAEAVNGVAATRIFGQEDRVQAHFAELNANTKAGWLQTVFYFALFISLVELTVYLTQAGLLAFGGSAVLGGELTAGVFIQFWLYFTLLTAPIKEIGEKYNVLQSAFASAERIFTILDEKHDPVEKADAATSSRGPATLRFEQVSFRYDKSKDFHALRDVSFVANAGQTVAIVGPTGAGKSTLISMIPRLQDPDVGSVSLDDVDLRQLRVEDLRARIAVVPQDVFLFSGTVLDNVRLFDDSIPEHEVAKALERVGALSFVESLDGGLAAKVRERGATFSQGQRQLLSFARALVADPDILILDEATASIDSETEARLQHALHEVLKNRTCLVVAHRLSTVRDADLILVMQDGRIVERGRHEELAGLGGTYAGMLQGL